MLGLMLLHYKYFREAIGPLQTNFDLFYKRGVDIIIYYKKVHHFFQFVVLFGKIETWQPPPPKQILKWLVSWKFILHLWLLHGSKFNQRFYLTQNIFLNFLDLKAPDNKEYKSSIFNSILFRYARILSCWTVLQW